MNEIIMTIFKFDKFKDTGYELNYYDTIQMK